MPRKPRFQFAGVPQHVIQRGNNREPCFYAEADYRRYIDDCHEAAIRHHCCIHAYVLMTNHVHLLVMKIGTRDQLFLMKKSKNRYQRAIVSNIRK